MQTSKAVVAVNKDAEAPIFALADLGVVGDLHKVLPAVVEAIDSGDRETGPMARTYLDHAATTPMVPEAVEAMTREPEPTRERVLAARLRAGGPQGGRGGAGVDRRSRRGPARVS